MNGLKQASVALATAGLLASGVAQATLFDRGGGLIYDDVLNVTWLQDANYAKTSGYHASGAMYFVDANAWVEQLVYGGFSDWRLPTLKPINGSNIDYSHSFNGTTDDAYNIGGTGTTYQGTVASEMAYMYYTNLGNLAQYTASGTDRGCYNTYGGSCLTNTGLFSNLQSYNYWTDLVSALHPSQNAWVFNMQNGGQGTSNQENYFYAWAVRDGDVTAPVPEPETYAMMLAGLGLLGLMTRRRKQKRNA